MAKKLLIVESPAKAKTIGKYLGGDFRVCSSVGHVCDLPKESGAIKITKISDGKWEFVPTYIVTEGKEKVVAELKAATKAASEIYLASDPDREGEAIAWHLKTVLEPVAGGKPFKRVTYNEITKSAVLKAVAEPRDIDMPLVDAQQARRILDRLVGYKVSPLLWKNINIVNNRSLSAGRVQSVALRLLVERQKEIDAFKPETYFLMGVEARKPGEGTSFIAKLSRFDGEKPVIKSREIANSIVLDLAESSLEVSDIKSQPKVRHALPPFTTSTMQQAASSVLGFSPGKTMKQAQTLYEHGRITYMRTDSVNVSEQARACAKEFITTNFGAAYYPATPNFFKSKADAQGAHEAIRPTDIAFTPEQAESQLEAAEAKLYSLIWRRFLASQMTDAKTTVKTISLVARKSALAHAYLFTASATVVDFDGFLKVMKLSLKKKKSEGEEDEDTDEVAYLPDVVIGDHLDALRWLADEKQTKGPSHYSEASLIKALEENGVGRPSTYAATIETLKMREYAKTEKKKLIPLERGILVCEWLVKKMDALFSVGYTAAMETELDKIAEQGEPMNQMLSDFYAEFLKSIDGCEPPPPDRDKFLVVFSLLSEVKEWKEPKKVGKRTYDDKAFYMSCREQFDSGNKKMSARQLEFLVKMAIAYADQIVDCEKRLGKAGFSVSTMMIKADPKDVVWAFGIMERIPSMMKNPFFKSIHEQFDNGHGITPKQMGILARAIGEQCTELEDCDIIRTQLLRFVPEGFGRVESDSDPLVSGMLELLESIPDDQWRPKSRRGKKMFDDHAFVLSLKDQYEHRRALSARQVASLKRVVDIYRVKIPDFDARAAKIGFSSSKEGKSVGDKT